MKHRSDLISTLHHLQMADDHARSFIADRPNAALTTTFKQVRNRIKSAVSDIKSNPKMPDIVRNGIDQELQSDVFAIPAINEKIPLLTPAKRELVERIVDGLLDGEKIQVEGL